MSPTILIMLAVTFLASLLGPLCGIGGGVIIKPVVDALGILPVAEVSFLSSMSVLTMSLATLGQDALARASRRGPAAGEDAPSFRSLAPFALGSAAGGVAGKFAFGRIASALPDAELVGAVQAVTLICCAVLVLVYLSRRDRIEAPKLTGAAAKAVAGAAAGACWAFLGIGGGPFNVAILAFFFGMSSKPAARASLFIIACSQTASLAYLVATASVPAVSLAALGGMCAMAVAGSVVGRRLQARLDSAAVDRLYWASLLLIIAISAYNVVRFLTA